MKEIILKKNIEVETLKKDMSKLKEEVKKKNNKRKYLNKIFFRIFKKMMNKYKMI